MASSITEDYVPYLWGSNDQELISNNSELVSKSRKPIIPSCQDPNPNYFLENRISYIANGGHVTPILNMISGKFGYVGHKIAGSMGDGTITAQAINSYTFEATPQIDYCVYGSFLTTNPTIHIDVKE